MKLGRARERWIAAAALVLAAIMLFALHWLVSDAVREGQRFRVASTVHADAAQFCLPLAPSERERCLGDVSRMPEQPAGVAP